MRIDIIDGLQAFAELRPAWEAVYDADPEAQFFLSWTFLSGHFRSLSDSWFVLAARPDENRSDYVAFFPLRIRTAERKDGGFFNHVFMAGNYVADYTGLICRPEFEEQAIPALASCVRQLNWTELHFENVMVSQRRFELFVQRFAKHDFELRELDRRKPDGIDNSICPVATLGADWDAYLDNKLSASTRQKIRRLLRQLDESTDFRITHATAETIDRDIDILFRFWVERWGAGKGKRLARIVKTHRAALKTACAAGSLFMPVLWKEDRPLGVLASLMDERKKAVLFLIGARDETFNSPPPGVLLHAHSIRHAIANGYTTYDFLRGNEPYKYSFGAEERRIKSFCIRTKDGKNIGNRLAPKSLPQVFRRALALHKQGQLVAAERAYREILEVDPKRKDALYGLGQLLAKRGDHLAAKRLFKSLVEMDPALFKIWFRLGRSCLARGELSEAAEAYCEVIEREPEFVNAYHDLGLALIQLELVAQATAAFEAALGLKPDFSEAEAGRKKTVQLRSEMAQEHIGRKVRAHADLVERMAALRAIAGAAERYQRKVDENRVVAKGVPAPRETAANDAVPPASVAN